MMNLPERAPCVPKAHSVACESGSVHSPRNDEGARLPVPFFVQWLHVMPLWEPDRLEAWIIYTVRYER